MTNARAIESNITDEDYEEFVRNEKGADTNFVT